MPLIAIVLACVLGQESDAERLKRLEEQVRRQQEELDRLGKQSKAGEGELTATFADGLRFKAKDGSVDLHIGGRFQENYRYVQDRPDASRTSPDTFSIRSARLQIDGTLWKDYGFVVQGDFASSATGSTATAQAAFVEWKRWKEFRLMFGQFKAPASQEELTSLLFHEFIERSILSRFEPAYEIGLQAYGRIADGVFGYQVAVTNGRGHLENAGRSRNDDNDEKELLLRLTTSPWCAEEEHPLHGLRIGAYGSITDVDDVAMSSSFDIATPELGVTFLDSTAGVLDGRRTRLGLELSYAYGPLGLRAEFLRREDEVQNGAVEEDLPITAWYVAVSWIVTGERKVFETRLAPEQPLDPGAGHWGAVEIVARVAGARIGREIEAVGTSLAGQSNRVTTYTLGVNWWLARNLRVSLDAIREDYHEDIDFGGGRIDGALNGVLARFQIDF